MAMADEREITDGDHPSDPVADRVAEVQVEDAVEPEVLVEGTDAGEIGDVNDGLSVDGHLRRV